MLIEDLIHELPLEVELLLIDLINFKETNKVLWPPNH